MCSNLLYYITDKNVIFIFKRTFSINETFQHSRFLLLSKRKLVLSVQRLLCLNLSTRWTKFNKKSFHTQPRAAEKPNRFVIFLSFPLLERTYLPTCRLQQYVPRRNQGYVRYKKKGQVLYNPEIVSFLQCSCTSCKIFSLCKVTEIVQLSKPIS